MAFSFTSLTLWVSVSYLTYSILFKILTNILTTRHTTRRNAAKALELMCEEPPFNRSHWPLGIDSLLRSLVAARAQRFPDDLIKRFEDMGTDTYVYRMLGEHSRCFANIDEQQGEKFHVTDSHQYLDKSNEPSLGFGVAVPR